MARHPWVAEADNGIRWGLQTVVPADHDALRRLLRIGQSMEELGFDSQSVRPYFEFNRVRDGEKETLAQFSERLFRFIEDHDVERLVIDMRWNNGGNTFLGQTLLLGVIASEKINQPGRLFVIIGRRTYSAAQNMATYFERFTNATFVGEPTGSSPNSFPASRIASRDSSYVS